MSIIAGLIGQGIISFGAGIAKKWVDYWIDQKAKDRDVDREIKRMEKLEKHASRTITLDQNDNTALVNTGRSMVMEAEDWNLREFEIKEYYDHIKSVKAPIDAYIRSGIAIIMTLGIIVIGAYLGYSYYVFGMNGAKSPNVETTIAAALINYSYFFYFLCVTIVFFYFGNAFGSKSNVVIRPFTSYPDLKKN
jgi:hypothetical protein